MANNISALTVRTYDEYLVKKIEAVIMKDNTNKPFAEVIYSPFDLAFEYAMKRQQVEQKNQIKFPLIICHKTSGLAISGMTHRVLGAKAPTYYTAYDYTETPAPTEEEPNPAPVTTRIARYFQVINVDIPYTIDILTKDEDQAYELAQEIIFLLIREPYVDVPKFLETADVPEDERTSFRFALMLNNDIADNTALETEAELGKLYRITLNVVVNDAALSRDVRAYLANNINVRIEDNFPDDIPGSISVNIDVV